MQRWFSQPSSSLLLSTRTAISQNVTAEPATDPTNQPSVTISRELSRGLSCNSRS